MSVTKNSIVAIIGPGAIGSVLAKNFVKGNRPVIIAGRDISKAGKLAAELGELASAKEIPAAIHDADVIILAIWFSEIPDFMSRYQAELPGKVIIDPSNPIAPDNNGGFKKVIPDAQSAGEINKGLLPDGAKLVKAFGTLGVASLAGASGQAPDPAVLFYATDDQDLNQLIEELIWDSGFEPVRVGGLNESARLEVFGALHEFGALGGTITKDKTEQLLQTKS